MPRSHTTPIITALLLAVAFLPTGYMGAYYALVQRSGSSFGGPFVTYRIDGVHTLFRPSHWIDRQIRPDYWGY